MIGKGLLSWTLVAVLLLSMALGCSKNPFAGARSDAEIASEVQNKINSDSNLPNKQITVTANNGTVTLSGSVASETERLAASNDAQVEGVKTVVNNLTVDSMAAAPAYSEPGAAAAPANTAPRNVSRRATTTRGVSAPANTAPSNASNMAANSAPPAPAPAPIATVSVPAGTELSIRTIDEVNSETASPGDTFMATLDSPVYVGDNIVIPANADVQGRVVDVKSAGKFKGQSELVLQLNRVSFNGKSYQVDSSRWSKTGSSRGKNTAAKVGGGAALGAIIGGIAGGGKGAAIGAGVGAGAGTGVQAVTKGQQIVLRPETLLTFSLNNPVTVVPSSANRSPNRSRMNQSDNQ
jgi:hypothetical protein